MEMRRGPGDDVHEVFIFWATISHMFSVVNDNSDPQPVVNVRSHGQRYAHPPSLGLGVQAAFTLLPLSALHSCADDVFARSWDTGKNYCKQATVYSRIKTLEF